MLSGKVLKPETADMYWSRSIIAGHDDVWLVHPIGKCPVDFGSVNENRTVPCWSLSVLMDYLPPFVRYKGFLLHLSVEKVDFRKYSVSYQTVIDDKVSISPVVRKSLVDACVAMIVRLSKMKLLLI